MADESFQEKTEEATPKKREKTREEGQVARSVEIASVFVLLAGVLMLYGLGSFSYRNFMETLRGGLSLTAIPSFDSPYVMQVLYSVSLRFLMFVSPIFLAIFIIALVSNFLQVGFMISSKAIEPKWNRLSLIAGFGRLFSMRSVVEAVKAVLKLCIIGVVSYLIVRRELDRITGLYTLGVGEILLYLVKIAFKIFIWVILVMMALALLDYLYQRWQFEQQIKMTKQEIKDEFKQSEGDPQVKSRIRSLQQQAARKRMMQEVPKADVIVTNPTHLALAIRYDALTMSAPRITAKGAGLLAQRIKAVAMEHAVPVVENKELAQNLYKLVDIGEEVPSQFFKAVAELLAYVYRLKGKTIG
ncbi:MAG: flagellar biosynthesis protein FlhB [Thermodesulfobacteriota bacterium]